MMSIGFKDFFVKSAKKYKLYTRFLLSVTFKVSLFALTQNAFYGNIIIR